MLRVVGRDAERIAVVTAMLVFAWGGSAASADDLIAFNQQMVALHGQGRYQEAVAIGERALALTERTLGADNSDALTIVNNLGSLYQQQGRYSEAERVIQRAVAGRERISGADHRGGAGLQPDPLRWAAEALQDSHDLGRLGSNFLLQQNISIPIDDAEIDGLKRCVAACKVIHLASPSREWEPGLKTGFVPQSRPPA